MPYIDTDRRQLIDAPLNDLIEWVKWNLLLMEHRMGVSAYIILKILTDAYAPKNYSEYNEVMGILECARQEYKRRTVGIDKTQKIYDRFAIYPDVDISLRDLVDVRIESIARKINHNISLVEKKCGVVNYVITRFLVGVYGDVVDPTDHYEALSVLKECKREYYRKYVAPYEDEAIERNGDVYPIA